MTFRRFIIAMGVLLILFLSMYTWNRNARVLDGVAGNVGLEVTGAVLSPVRQLQDLVTGTWARYLDLVDVRRKNEELEKRVRDLEALLLAHREDMAELTRLRDLLRLPVDETWTPVGARVLAGHLGPNALLDTITINRGYASGAAPGTPIVTHKGLVGRVLRASPHTSTAMLLTNPGSRIAVFSQQTRYAGILTGEGEGAHLAVRYVPRDTTARAGELLITSGLDGKFPKGIPVARILTIAPSNYTEFMTIEAEPLVDLRHIEEVLLLEPTGVVRPPMAPEADVLDLEPLDAPRGAAPQGTASPAARGGG